jgi:hypothetical protein
VVNAILNTLGQLTGDDWIALVCGLGGASFLGCGIGYAIAAWREGDAHVYYHSEPPVARVAPADRGDLLWRGASDTDSDSRHVA